MSDYAIIFQALGVLGLGALILSWLRSRRPANSRDALPEVTPGTPYRVASAKITPELRKQFSLSEAARI